VRVEVVDPSGHGLGLAIGLLELGHQVRYVPARDAGGEPGQMERMRRELVAQMFAGGDPFDGDAELLVLVDVFADYLHCLDEGVGVLGTAEVRDPLQADAGILVYPKRLQWFCERAQREGQVAVVDMSDHRHPRELAFEAMPGVTRFAREQVAADGGRWQPFPFLFNTAMLWLEYTRPKQQWWIDVRPAAWDWAFCGTVDHERYGGERRAQLERLAARWPQLRGLVIGQQSFQDVLGALQSVRFGLDLPGVGELCFRLHECLALGVPVWRPDSGEVSLPDGLSDLVFADPSQAPAIEPAEVRAAYLRHYSPMAAATCLLDGCAAGRAAATELVAGPAR